MNKKKLSLRLILIFVSAVMCAVCLVGASGYIAFIKYPSIGAQGANELRQVIGDEAVARLEGMVFQIQDTLLRMLYRAGARPQAPWSAEPMAQGITMSQATAPNQIAKSQNHQGLQPNQTAIAQNASTPSGIASSGALAEPPQTPVPPAATTEAACPPSMVAIGDMKGEGVWSPYLTDSFFGKVAACRTFFQPDLERPYAIAAVVAFNLNMVNLHYVLGSQEPVSSVSIDRPGNILPADLKPNLLLAVFNGGFRARHGHFGVMVDGITLIPPIDEFGTIALYKDGALRIGAWGADITPSADIVFWRQNGPLLVQKGQVNPRIYNQSPQDWGSSLDGTFPVATWRSAMGISADGKTMYYAAGPSLTLESLAQSLITAGAYQAVQLDINNYWVYFGEVVFNGGKPKTIPLFPEWKDNPDRYLSPYIRDFFYITAKHN